MDIEALAREHGTGGWQTLDDMVRFGEYVAVVQREACAKNLRDAASRIAPEGKLTNQYERHMADVLNEIADELLTRSNVEVRGGPTTEGDTE